MNAYWQLVIFFFAAVNPAAVALAAARLRENRDVSREWRTPAIALAIAVVVYAVAAFGAERLLSGLEIEPESFRVAAGIVMAAAGVLAIWRGAPPAEGDGGRAWAAVFPIALPLLVSPAGLVAAVTYGADDGGGKALGALLVSLAVAGALLVAQPAKRMPALDAVARLTGALLVAVAAGLVVDGVRAI